MVFGKNKDLEVVRGIAAFLVFLCHLIDKVEWPVFQDYFFFRLIGNWGTESVIIFFVLSGIVISMSQKRKPRNFKQFIRNRLIRIVPIYAVGLLLGIIAEVLIDGQFESWNNFWVSLFFVSTLQGYIGNPLEYSAVIWSLSFEMFFYIVYAITIGKKQQLLLLIWLIISLLAIPIHMFISIDNVVINHILAMLAYSFLWLLGYYAFRFRNKWDVHQFSLMLSIGGLPLISRLQITDQYYDVIKYALFGIFSLPMFLYFLKENPVNKPKWLLPVQLLLLLVASFHLLKFSESLLISKLIYVMLPLGLFIMALKFDWTLKFFKPVRAVCARLGDISYALYIVHYPLLFILAFWFKDQLHWVPLISLCIFVISYFLDVKLQPKIYQFFHKTV